MSDDNMTVRERYLEQMVESASQEGLLLMLVEGAVNFIRRAIFAHEKGKYDDVNNYLIKAQNIYLELVVVLDLDAGEFAENLGLVYQYLYNLLIEANLEKNIDKIKQGLGIAEQIKDLWKETVDKAHGKDEMEEPLSKVADKSIDPAKLKKTGAYEPTGAAGLSEIAPPAEEAQSRLNLTG